MDKETIYVYMYPEEYSALKKETLPFVRTWVDLRTLCCVKKPVTETQINTV